jgi:hypothetical protein
MSPESPSSGDHFCRVDGGSNPFVLKPLLDLSRGPPQLKSINPYVLGPAMIPPIHNVKPRAASQPSANLLSNQSSAEAFPHPSRSMSPSAAQPLASNTTMGSLKRSSRVSTFPDAPPVNASNDPPVHKNHGRSMNTDELPILQSNSET